MNFHDKRVRIALLILAVLLVIIGFRIVSNIIARNAEAERSGQERVAVVTTSHAQRKTIVPNLNSQAPLTPYGRRMSPPKWTDALNASSSMKVMLFPQAMRSSFWNRPIQAQDSSQQRVLTLTQKQTCRKRRPIWLVMKSFIKKGLSPKNRWTICVLPSRMPGENWMRQKAVLTPPSPNRAAPPSPRRGQALSEKDTIRKDIMQNRNRPFQHCRYLHAPCQNRYP